MDFRERGQFLGLVAGALAAPLVMTVGEALLPGTSFLTQFVTQLAVPGAFVAAAGFAGDKIARFLEGHRVPQQPPSPFQSSQSPNTGEVSSFLEYDQGVHKGMPVKSNFIPRHGLSRITTNSRER